MKANPSRYARRYSPQEKSRILNAWASSSLPPNEFAARHDIAKATLERWVEENAKSNVVVFKEARLPGKRASKTAPKTDVVLELEFSSGVRVKIYDEKMIPLVLTSLVRAS